MLLDEPLIYTTLEVTYVGRCQSVNRLTRLQSPHVQRFNNIYNLKDDWVSTRQIGYSGNKTSDLEEEDEKSKT